MTFGEALQAFKIGKRVACDGWNGKVYYDAAIGPEIRRLGGKPPGAGTAQSDLESDRHQAFLQCIEDALKSKPDR